jgi:hypothetical protein
LFERPLELAESFGEAMHRLAHGRHAVIEISLGAALDGVADLSQILKDRTAKPTEILVTRAGFACVRCSQAL